MLFIYEGHRGNIYSAMKFVFHTFSMNIKIFYFSATTSDLVTNVSDTAVVQHYQTSATILDVQ